jgi:hypothetical protein
MDARIEVTQPANISFLVVHNGAICAPLLVERLSFIGKVGSEAARLQYQTAYTPKEFPSAKRVSSDDPL